MKIYTKKFAKTKKIFNCEDLTPNKEYEVFAIVKHDKFFSGTGIAVITDDGYMRVVCSSFFE